ncbi:MAG TPA: tetratricopeptide repeat protein [Terracidiphilus sp.]|jgi:Flp pilus assembly protein TadD
MKNLRILAVFPVLAALFYQLCRPPAGTHAAAAKPQADPTASRAVDSITGQESAPATAPSSAPAAKPVTAHATAPETWSRDVAPLLYSHCTTCHHPGGAGPFSLLTYGDARRWAPQMLTVTQSRFMPPWLPEPGYGDFADVRRLTDQEQALLKRWINGGIPQGDPRDAPAPPHYDTTWQLGKPDLILQTERPFTLQAGGTDVFRNLIIPYPLKETHYIRAMEILPSPARVVHHANVLIDRTASLRRSHPAAWQDGVPGMELLMDAGNRFDPDSHFLFWKPDTPALVEPEGMSWRLDPGNDLVLNIHLKPSGKPETVTAQLGLYFTNDPPVQQPMLLQLDRDDALDIPPGDSNFVVEDSLTLPVDVDVLGIYPHTHYLGRDMEGWAILPDGEKKWLVWIKDWDINRQSVYRYREPLLLPRGTVLHMKYTFDNSPANPHNPHSPPVRVQAGNRSEDEMSHLWLQVLPVNTPANAADPRLLLEEAWMRNRLSKSPMDRVSLYNLAAALAGQGKFTEAAAIYERELKLDPTNARTITALGAALEGAGQFEPARERYRSAIAIAAPADSGGCDARFDLARLGVRRAEYAEAEKEFRALLAACPEDAESRSGLGAALLGAGRKENAAREFRRALELDAGDFTALYNLGAMAADAGDAEQAAKLLESALRSWPASPDAHEKLAMAYAQRNRLNDALAHLRTAAGIAPEDPQVHSLLSQILDAMGQSEEAFAEQKRALQLNPQDADGWNNLGALLARGGQTAAARSAFEHALQLQPDHAQAKANLARLQGQN